MIVLIDDERVFLNKPEDDLVILRNSKEALKWFSEIDENFVIDQLWFDHDLAIVDGKKDTSIPVVRKLEELCFFDKSPIIHQVVVHTANNVGGKEIQIAMSRYFNTVRVAAGDYLTVDGTIEREDDEC